MLLLYQVLLNAYRFGDLTQIYPVARGASPLLITLFTMITVSDVLQTMEVISDYDFWRYHNLRHCTVPNEVCWFHWDYWQLLLAFLLRVIQLLMQKALALQKAQ